tara:strand:+ start:69 stop:929 length:861 start_codon:yes stop_codon:yes gene_type:complete
MSYKFSTGSVRRGDVFFEDDRTGEPTYIDFGQDTITLRPSGSQILHATSTKIGIGTDNPSEILTIQGTESNTDETFIHFIEDGSDRAKVGINTSNNLVIHNQFSNKHIVFKVNDGDGGTLEGLRIRSNNNDNRGEVVVNEGSESLIDFRVEGMTDQHLIFADGGNDKVGISTDTPTSGMHIRTSVATSFQVNSTDVTLDDEDCFVIADASSGPITITLPSPTGIGGRFYTIKRKDTSGSSVTITTAAGKTFDGSSSSFTLAPLCSITLQSDNASNWWKVAEFIDPP